MPWMKHRIDRLLLVACLAALPMAVHAQDLEDATLSELVLQAIKTHEAVAYSLLARHYKRVAAHLANISTAVTGRIEDHTEPGLRTEELAKVYRTFLRNQRTVVQEWFGTEVAERLFQQVLSQISPGLRDTLKRYDLV